MRRIPLWISALFVLFAGTGRVLGFTLTDSNARLIINTSEAFTTQEWTVDGEENLTGGSGYWFGVGSPLGTSTTRTVAIQAEPNIMEVRYNFSNAFATVRYTLEGGPVGSGEATVTESVTLSTYVHEWVQPLYLYNDYNLSSTDIAMMDAAGSLAQYGGGRLLTITSTAAPLHYEAADRESLLTKFNGVPPLRLDDAPALGSIVSPASGDVASALNWRFAVAPRSYQTITTTKRLMRGTPSAIPEPGSVALLATALVPVFVSRRRTT